MQFSNNNVTEIVVPAGVPFSPGFDVIGIGTELPPELAAYEPIGGGDPVVAAIVFYSAAYNPNGTTPQVKFFWIGIGSSPSIEASSLNIGVGIVANASVSQVAVINSGLSVVPSVQSGVMTMGYVAVNHLDNSIMVLGERGSGATLSDGELAVLTNAGGTSGTVSGSVIVS